MKKIFFVICLAVSFFIMAKSSVRKDTYWNYGETFFNRKEYMPAVEWYKRVVSSKAYKSKALYRIAACYRAVNKTDEACSYAQALLKDPSGRSDSVRVLCGMIFKEAGEYQRARDLFAQLYKRNPTEANALQRNSCDSALAWMRQPVNIKLENLKSANTALSEISPQLDTFGAILFSSNRENTIIKKKNNVSGEPFFDLYRMTSTGKVSAFESTINTMHHEFAPALSPSGDTLFFTRSMDAKKNSGEDSVNRLKLYCSQKNGAKKWDEAHIFFLNDQQASFAHPHIELSGRMFFFASDMLGGYGKSDLYVCFRKDSLWSKPLNLGPIINSAENETYPFYHKGVLYFSSDRISGMGGFDIYKAMQKRGEWVRIGNLKFPVNTAGDELSFILTTDGKTGYLSSNRPGGLGNEDLYRIIFQE